MIGIVAAEKWTKEVQRSDWTVRLSKWWLKKIDGVYGKRDGGQVVLISLWPCPLLCEPSRLLQTVSRVFSNFRVCYETVLT